MMQGAYHAKDGGDAPAAQSGRLAGAASAALAGAEVDRGVQLSCGEHSDYGLLTLVNQDAHIPALQVRKLCSCPSTNTSPCASLGLIGQGVHVGSLQVQDSKLSPRFSFCRNGPYD